MPQPSTGSRRAARRRLIFQKLDERRVLASITGVVFDDANDSSVREAAEVGAAGRLVFIDDNVNESLDAGERYVQSDSDGRFRFDSVPVGDHRVVLFGGGRSQVQTTPVAAGVISSATVNHPPVAVVAAADDLAAAFAEGDRIALLGGGSLTADGSVVSLSRLAGGDLVIVSADEIGSEVLRVGGDLANPADVDGSTAELAGFVVQDAAIDAGGRGLLIGHAAGEQPDDWVGWSVDVDGDGVQRLTTRLSPGARVIGDSNPSVLAASRTILVQPVELVDGGGAAAELLVYNNSTAEFIGAPVSVDAGSELVAFSDRAGILILRSGDQLVGYDVDGGFAELYRVEESELGGDVVLAIDPVREMLVAVNAADNLVALLGMETGDLIRQFALDLSLVGVPSAIDLDPQLTAIVVAGSAGAVELTLRRPVAQVVQINSVDDAAEADFGIRSIGTNDAPVYQTMPMLQGVEDEVLVAPAGTLTAGTADAQGDRIVVLPGGESTTPGGGAAEISVDGSLRYTPAADFSGQDTVDVQLHDGRSTRTVSLRIDVAAVADRPTEATLSIPPVSESVQIGVVVGQLTVADPDGTDDLQITIDDPRFIHRDGDIVFVGPEPLDFESEPRIPLEVQIRDAAADETLIVNRTITVLDADDPVTDIIINSTQVRENRPGDRISDVAVIDEDEDQFHAITVSDDRFEVVFGQLRLRTGESVDFEAEPTITLVVTATFGSDSFTKSITLTVLDSPEVPGEVQLTGPGEVLERDPGAVVGNITVGGNPGQNGHTLSVNDGRFVIADGVLKLADGVSVRRIDQEIIQVRVTATANAGGSSTTGTFDIEVLENELPFHNAALPEDVNGDGEVMPSDALAIINFLNSFGPSPVGPGNPNFFYDVNGDGMVTALDALLIINFLNVNSGGPTTGTGGEPGRGGGEPLEDSFAASAVDSESDDLVAALLPYADDAFRQEQRRNLETIRQARANGQVAAIVTSVDDGCRLMVFDREEWDARFTPDEASTEAGDSGDETLEETLTLISHR